MKRRILYIGNALSAHGATPTTIETLGGLLAEDHQVTVVSKQRNKAIRLLDMCLTLVARSNKTDVVLIDVYSSAAFWFALVTGWMCRMFNLKYIPIAHGGSLPERLSRKSTRAGKFFNRAYACVTPSGFLQKKLRDQGIECMVIPNPIDLQQYTFRPEDTGPELLWVRSLHHVYNPDMALRVLRNILEHKSRARLTMVGPEKSVTIDALKARAEESGIADHITFTGLLPKEDWLKLAESHTFFMNTTNVDNAPVTVVEAMALGMIVVSTDAGGLPYMIRDRINGFLVPPDDDKAMAEIILACMDNRYDLAQIRNNARQYAESFDRSIVRKQWNTLLDTL